MKIPFYKIIKGKLIPFELEVDDILSVEKSYAPYFGFSTYFYKLDGLSFTSIMSIKDITNIVDNRRASSLEDSFNYIIETILEIIPQNNIEEVCLTNDGKSIIEGDFITFDWGDSLVKHGWPASSLYHGKEPKMITTCKQIADGLAKFKDEYHQHCVEAGWWESNREDGTTLALIHSEISEAMEAIRQNKNDDHLPSRPGAEVELADAILRILDFCGRKGYDISGALIEKMEYNLKREDHKPENRAKENGKKF